MNSKIKTKGSVIASLLAPGVLLFTLCCIIPLVVAFYYSLFNWDGGITKTYVGFKNYVELLHDAAFWMAFKNNLLFVLYSVIGQIGIAFIVSMLLTSRSVKAKNFHRTVIFFPVVLSSIVVAYLWQIIYNKDYGLLNRMLELLHLESLIRPWLDDEVINERMSNKYLGDTTVRICTDSSRGVGARFGETIRSYVQEYGTAKSLDAIPFALAGWLRYFYAFDDAGKAFALAPDPLAQELHDVVIQVEFGNPDSLKDQLQGVLSNKEIFGSDLYEAGVAQKIEEYFKEEIAGFGAVRSTLKKHQR